MNRRLNPSKIPFRPEVLPRLSVLISIVCPLWSLDPLPPPPSAWRLGTARPTSLWHVLPVHPLHAGASAAAPFNLSARNCAPVAKAPIVAVFVWIPIHVSNHFLGSLPPADVWSPCVMQQSDLQIDCLKKAWHQARPDTRIRSNYIQFLYVV